MSPPAFIYKPQAASRPPPPWQPEQMQPPVAAALGSGASSVCGAAGGTLRTPSSLSGRYGVRRCRSELDLPAGCAAPPVRQPFRPAAARRSAAVRGSVVVYPGDRPSASPPPRFCCSPAAATCAAMARAERCCAQALQLCLLLGQRLCTCRRLAVLQGRCRPLPGSKPSPGLSLLCSALLFQGCSGEDRGPCPAGPASSRGSDALPSAGSALHGHAGWWLL